MAKRKWYVVTVGKRVGVFKTWIEVSPLVTGVSGALHQSFPSEEEANAIFAQEQRKGNVRVVGGDAMSSSRVMELPATSGQSSGDPDSRRPLTPRVAAAGYSDQGSHLSSPAMVNIEANGPTLSSPSSSPPTDVTQLAPLLSSSPLSPLVLQESELEPNVYSQQSVSPQRVISIHASSSASGRMATSTVQLSSSDNSFPPLTINFPSPVQHTRCSGSCGEPNVDDLTSAVGALGLSQSQHVPRVIDPRSPLTHPNPVPGSPPSSSRRPSPRSQSEGAASLLFSG